MLGACFHLVSDEKNNIKIKNTTNLLLCDFYPQIRTVSGKLTAVMKCLLSCFVRPWLLSQHFTCLQRELEVFVVGLDRQPLRNCPHSSCGLHLSHWCSTPATAASVVSQVYMCLTDIITANSNVSIQQSWDTREHLVMLCLSWSTSRGRSSFKASSSDPQRFMKTAAPSTESIHHTKLHNCNIYFLHIVMLLGINAVKTEHE